jgi:collagenase-like PrtC family protease
MADIQAESPPDIEVEVFAYGRLPLAYSARCFTARSCNLPKDDCQYRCFDFPDGLMLKAQDDTSFLALNGIQTQSAHTFNLLSDLKRMQELGVDVVRISPQSNGTEQIVDLFYKCLTGEMSLEEGSAKLEPLLLVGSCDGYWHGEAGMEDRAQTAAKKMV